MLIAQLKEQVANLSQDKKTLTSEMKSWQLKYEESVSKVLKRWPKSEISPNSKIGHIKKYQNVLSQLNWKLERLSSQSSV